MPMGKGCPHLRKYPMSLTESVKNMYLVYLFQRFVRNQFFFLLIKFFLFIYNNFVKNMHIYSVICSCSNWRYQLGKSRYRNRF